MLAKGRVAIADRLDGMATPAGEEVVNLCYCDETGIGQEPIAVMAGIVVDSSWMHLTKTHWQDLLDILSERVGRQVVELHTRDFYAGNDIWRHRINGPERTEVFNAIFAWLAERKHHIVYSAVVKSSFDRAFATQDIPDGFDYWRFLGFHLVLAMQKHGQREKGVKGNTLFIFDNEERQRLRFTDLIVRPPAWSDEYYQRREKQDQLDQIIDVPYFGDSRDVVLIQLADLVAFLLRRHAEIQGGLIGPRYQGEDQKIAAWAKAISDRSIGRSFMYPKTGRDYAEELFYQHAPASICDLG
jgi:hypothetical protein